MNKKKTRTDLPERYWPRTLTGWLLLLPQLPRMPIRALVYRLHMSHERRVEWRLMENRAFKGFDDLAGAAGWLTPFMIIQAVLLILLAIFFDRIDGTRIWEFFSPWWGQMLGLVLVTVAAVLLYAIRDRRPYAYASLEIGLAEVAVWSALGNRSSSALESSLKVAAGLYLLVRGLDNWNVGPERSRKAAEKRAERAAKKEKQRAEAKETEVRSRRELAEQAKRFVDEGNGPGS